MDDKQRARLARLRRRYVDTKKPAEPYSSAGIVLSLGEASARIRRYQKLGITIERIDPVGDDVAVTCRIPLTLSFSHFDNDG